MAPIDLLGAKLDVPANWRVATAVLIGPPSQPEKMPGPTLAQSVPFSDSLTLIAEPLKETLTPQGYLEAQLRQLRQGGEQRTLVSSEQVEHQGQPAVIAELVGDTAAGLRVRQLELIVCRDAVAWVVIATTLDNLAFAGKKGELLAMIRSLR